MNHLLSRLVRSVSRVNSVTQKVVSKRFASLTVTRHPIPRLGRHNTPFDCRAQTFQTPFGRLTDVPSASGSACRRADVPSASGPACRRADVPSALGPAYRRESGDAAIVSLDDRWEGQADNAEPRARALRLMRGLLGQGRFPTAGSLVQFAQRGELLESVRRVSDTNRRSGGL